MLPGSIHCKVAEAEHSLQAPSCHATSYLGLVGVGQNLSSSVLLWCILWIHKTLDIWRFWLGMTSMLFLNPLRTWWGGGGSEMHFVCVCHFITILFPKRRWTWSWGCNQNKNHKEVLKCQQKLKQFFWDETSVLVLSGLCTPQSGISCLYAFADLKPFFLFTFEMNICLDLAFIDCLIFKHT